MNYYLGIDQGTTGTTTLLLDENFNQIAKSHLEHRQFYPKPGWVEHDPEEIWEKVRDTVTSVLAEAGVSFEDIRCLGLDNQGETVVVWNRKTGRPVYPAIVWQDRRTSAYADEVREKYGPLIREKTGLLVDSYFSGLKIRWILDNVADVREAAERGEILAGTTDAWLIWKMTGGKVFATDQSTASRTMLFNIHTGDWDPDILEALDIPKNILPEIRNSAGDFGVTDRDAFAGGAIPVTGNLVDQQAALFGEACLKKGMVKTTFGTGAFMLMNTGKKPITSEDGLLTTVAWGLPNEKLTFALDGGVYIAGAAITWLKNGIHLIDHPAETETLSRAAKTNGGVYFVPAFAGLAAPHWDQYARGTIIGLTGGTTREQLVRATLESICYQVRDILEVMRKDSGIPINVMRVDGGSAVNAFMMQFLSDILNIPVEVPVITETSALGAACLAALGIGDVGSAEDLEKIWKRKVRYDPGMTHEQRTELLHFWHKAVERSKDWCEEKSSF